MTRSRVLTLLAVVGILLDGWVAANGALWYRTADFYCLREGARLTAIGADPYDERLWSPVIGTTFPDPLRGSGTSSCVARYASPLVTAVVMLPFGILPLEISASLWMALSFAAVILGMRWVWQAAGGSRSLAGVFAAVVISSQPFWLLVVGGQITGVLVGLTGAAMWLAHRGHAALSGAALAALVIKPQVAGLFVPAVVLRDALSGRPRTLVGAAMAAGVLLAASLVARPAWIPAWLDEVGGRRLGYTSLLPSAWGLSSDLFGTMAWAPVLIALAVASVALLVRGRALDRVSFAALALPLSLFAMPHVWSYDFLPLTLSWGVALALADAMPAMRRMVVITLTLGAASVMPWSLYAIGLARGQENLSALVPVSAALVVAGAVAIRPARVEAAA